MTVQLEGSFPKTANLALCISFVKEENQRERSDYLGGMTSFMSVRAFERGSIQLSGGAECRDYLLCFIYISDSGE
jgi:hypothetical protein